MWKKGSSENTTWDEISNLIPLLSRGDHEIVIGSDSQPFRDGFVIATAICFLASEKSLNRRFFYERVKHRRHPESLYERIYLETMASVETAQRLRCIREDLNISVHLDVSPSESRNRTARYTSTMVSIVRGYGIEKVEVKPDSWGASSVADKYTKTW